MLDRNEKIRMIVETEVDGMDMEGLVMYAEDHMFDHLDGKTDDYIEELFLEAMDGRVG